MNKMNINDPRAKRWGNFAKIAAILGVGFFVAPFVFTAITGLIGLIIAGAIVGATWMVLPAVEAAAANMRLKLIKAEAAKNPVETLQNDLKNKTVALNDRKSAIEKLNAQIRNFADKLDDIKERFGANDSGYIKLSSDLQELKKVYKHRCDKWNEARRQLDRFAEEIDRAGMIWEAAQAASAAREASGLTEDEFYVKLKTETAFDAIQLGYNEALASLDSSLIDDPVKALPSGNERQVIELTPSNVKVNI